MNGGVGVWMWTAALPDLLGSACEVAVIVTAPAGAVVGAVYKPVELIESSVPPELIAQVTAVFELPVTVAVNCWVCAGAPERFGQRVLTWLGLTLTETGGGPELPPPHATRKAAKTSIKQSPAIW